MLHFRKDDGEWVEIKPLKSIIPMEDEKSPTEIMEEIRKRIKFMRDNSEWLRVKNTARYDEFLLTLDSADFYMERFEIEQAEMEIERARILINMK